MNFDHKLNPDNEQKPLPKTSGCKIDCKRLRNLRNSLAICKQSAQIVNDYFVSLLRRKLLTSDRFHLNFKRILPGGYLSIMTECLLCEKSMFSVQRCLMLIRLKILFCTFKTRFVAKMIYYTIFRKLK